MDKITTNGLYKYFNELCAVNDVNLSIGNEIFGLLGPNGAGKSTVVKILTTLMKPTHGVAKVCGYDVVKDPVKVRESISYVPQEMAIDTMMTGRENALLFARLYHIPRPRDRVDEALAIMGLSGRADEIVRQYSGGMRRRLELVQALIHRPRVLFLDEPTLGLDVVARKMIWEHLEKLKKDGLAIFTTTHYMDEADRYCDRVAIIRNGRILATDTPANFRREIGSEVIIASISGTIRPCDLADMLVLGASEHELKVAADDTEEALRRLPRELTRRGIDLRSISVRETTLDDALMYMLNGGVPPP